MLVNAGTQIVIYHDLILHEHFHLSLWSLLFCFLSPFLKFVFLLFMSKSVFLYISFFFYCSNSYKHANHRLPLIISHSLIEYEKLFLFFFLFCYAKSVFVFFSFVSLKCMNLFYFGLPRGRKRFLFSFCKWQPDDTKKKTVLLLLVTYC